MKKSINEAREEVLRRFLNNPSGTKQLAEAAISVISWRSMKKLTEALNLENEVKKHHKNQQ
jgi:hypothetical protein